MGKKFLTSVVVSIVMVIVYMALFTPSANKNIKKTEAQIQEEIKNIQAKIYDIKSEASAENVDTEIKNLKQEIMEESANFPTEPGVATFLREVAIIGDSSGLQILLFQPLDPVNEGLFEEMPIKIRIRGTYKQLATFFYGIANLNRVVKIDELKITGPINNSGIIMTESDVLVTTYRMLGGA